MQGIYSHTSETNHVSRVYIFFCSCSVVSVFGTWIFISHVECLVLLHYYYYYYYFVNNLLQINTDFV